jgi:anti-sigma factor RsiW
MNYKPDEATLAAYLYGELPPRETEQVKSWLEQHPENAAELERLVFVRQALGALHDKEVLAPSMPWSDARKAANRRPARVKPVLGIAASLLFLLAAGWMLRPEIQAGNGQLTIRFGANRAENTAQADVRPTKAEVEEMIREALHNQDLVWQAAWREEQRTLLEAVNQRGSANGRMAAELIALTRQASAGQMEASVAELQKENLKMMQDYLQLATSQQAAYVEKLLTDFSKFLLEQRQRDLNLITARLAGVEQNTNQFREETGQILAGILTTPGPANKNQNNYRQAY